MTRAWRRRYGAGPAHLAVLLATFAVAVYAVTRITDEPGLVRIAVWFVGAAVIWDLVLGPLLALADRGLRAAVARVPRVSPLNYLRVPALLSAALLLVSAPLVLRRSEQVYAAKSGLSAEPYLGRWLAVTAVLFMLSAAAYATTVVRRRR